MSPLLKAVVERRLFAGTGTPEALAGLAGTDPHTNAYFYSNLYLGLYLEAIGRTEESRG